MSNAISRPVFIENQMSRIIQSPCSSILIGPYYLENAIRCSICSFSLITRVLNNSCTTPLYHRTLLVLTRLLILIIPYWHIRIRQPFTSTHTVTIRTLVSENCTDTRAVIGRRITSVVFRSNS